MLRAVFPRRVNQRIRNGVGSFERSRTEFDKLDLASELGYPKQVFGGRPPQQLAVCGDLFPAKTDLLALSLEETQGAYSHSPAHQYDQQWSRHSQERAF